LKHNAGGTAHVAIRHRQLAKDIGKAQVAARKAIRKAATAERRKLRAINRELGRQVKRDIAASNAKIAQEFESKIAHEFDSDTIAIAIGVTDARQ
jgi:hypothetical protein